MEKQPTLKQAKRSQKSLKKAPVKVVYISNPMKIKASPSEFRAVVQQLTGKYATSPPSYEPPQIPKQDNNNNNNNNNNNDQDQDHQEYEGCETGGHGYPSTRSDEESAGFLEDQVVDDFVITSEMVDAFSPLFPSDFRS
ncbi:hypothetical protein SSX86_022598 [Deinandra increscens subsp. villosa]|uniref:VQ domain-containing protein n=1 Tax=Deinandra increscens subsp. villosa TaxID=3103831 RepID=A0AAP0CJC5_9ASTR